MRTIPALIAATALVVSLAGCSGSGGAAGSCDPFATSGAASTLVDATGAFGTQPNVTFPTPLITTGVEVTTITAGDGPVIRAGQIADVQVAVFAGATGDLVTASSWDPANPVRRTAGDSKDGLAKVVTCAPVGSRLASTMTVADLFGEAGIDPKYGLAVDDTLVVVVDVERAFMGRADGADQLPQSGFPVVVLAPNGQPGITVPQAEPPTDLQIAVLKKGSGDTVAKGDRVVLHYTGILWDTKKVFDSSWDRGAPVTLVAASSADAQGGLVPGFAKALIGQRVGSQILAVIPPEFGYGDVAQSSVPAGSTMVFVIDILGIEK